MRFAIADWPGASPAPLSRLSRVSRAIRSLCSPPGEGDLTQRQQSKQRKDRGRAGRTERTRALCAPKRRRRQEAVAATRAPGSDSRSFACFAVAPPTNRRWLRQRRKEGKKKIPRAVCTPYVSAAHGRPSAAPHADPRVAMADCRSAWASAGPPFRVFRVFRGCPSDESRMAQGKRQRGRVGRGGRSGRSGRSGRGEPAAA